MWKLIVSFLALSVLVGAENVNPKKFPFIISIRNGDKHICAGSMLINNFTLTAARCVEGAKADSLVVHIGTVDLNSAGNVYKVLDIKFHPKYNSQNHEYAAALLLTEKMQYKSTMLPIGLSDKQVGGRVEMTAAGWKLKGDRNPNGILQFKMVTSLSNDACGKQLKTSVPDSVMCTENDSGYDKDREYFSDIGGPVILKESLVGVIVASNRPSKSKQPDINVRVSTMLSWIIKTVLS